MFSVITGLVLGMAAGILNFKLLLLIYQKIGELDSRRGGILAVGGYLLHAAVYVGLVALAVLVEPISIGGVIAGLIAASVINLLGSRTNVSKPVPAGDQETMDL